MAKDAFRPKARRPRGFLDRRGPALAAERALVERIARVYEAWGFEALETPAFEYADALGKFLPDQDRPNEGVFALEDDDGQWMALRYDLTAPLARFVAENSGALPKPYRRWAAGPVWRNEKPGPGRFREFWQCDADTVGSASPAADAEMIAMACAALEAAGVARGRYLLKFSSRGLLDGVLETIGVGGEEVSRRLTIQRAIDKYDRLGLAGVSALLGQGRKDESGDFTKGAGLSSSEIDVVLKFVAAGRWQFGESTPETRERIARGELVASADNFPGEDIVYSSKPRLRELEELLRTSKRGEQVLNEVREILDLTAAMGCGEDRVLLDPGIVRGLEYYTGAVFEAELIGVADEAENVIRYGSIGGGGRYDDLVARFTGERIPATGFSIGVSRLAAALEAAKQDQANADGPIVVLPFDREGIAECFALAAKLRTELRRAAEVYLGGAGPKAQLKYADKRNAPVAIILGSDERAKGEVTLKDMKLGAALSKDIADHKEWREAQPAQITVKQAELVAAVKRMLGGGR